MNTFGEKYRVTVFGESHGPAIGVVVDGVPPGTRLDMERISRDLARRAPGQGDYSTPRMEADVPELVSGVVDGVATGAPIACLILNTDTRPSDYKAAFRPGQADWTAFAKYGGHDDRRGGGRFSGRLTAGLVFAGAIAKALLEARGVEIYGRVQSVGGESDAIRLYDMMLTGSPSKTIEVTKRILKGISEKDFPAYDETRDAFLETIALARDEGDSVGGVVEAVCFGVPAGTGEPFFASVESRMAALLFSVPAVKGVEFGRGFAFSSMLGSEANDPIVMDEGRISSLSNNNGGLLGGIANGLPISLRAAIKPTASIAVPQRTVDPVTMAPTVLELEGRHDPCIAPRAVPVVEACCALALADLMMLSGAL